MHTLVLALGASSLAIFGGEVREASAKAGIPTPPVVVSQELSNPAWVVFPCALEYVGHPDCVGRPPVTTVYIHPASLKESRWVLTLWAYHEVCHISLGHRWPVGTTEEEMERDHAEVRECQIDLLGRARYNVLRKIIFGNTHSSVPVRPVAPALGGVATSPW